MKDIRPQTYMELCKELSLRPDGVYQLESGQDQETISLHFEPRQANREQPPSTPKIIPDLRIRALGGVLARRRKGEELTHPATWCQIIICSGTNWGWATSAPSPKDRA